MTDIIYTVYTDCELMGGSEHAQGKIYHSEAELQELVETSTPNVPYLLLEHLRKNPDDMSKYWFSDRCENYWQPR